MIWRERTQVDRLEDEVFVHRILIGFLFLDMAIRVAISVYSGIEAALRGIL